MAHYFTKNGKDVEIANTFIEMVLKRTGLDKFIEICLNILKILFDNVNSYPMFLEAKKFADLWLEKIITVLSSLNLKKS